MTNREEGRIAPFHRRTIGSWLGLKALAVLIIIGGLSFIVEFPVSRPTDDKTLDTFVCETVGKWRAEYACNPELQVARINIDFHKEPRFFAEGEGVVITPVAIDLHGSQKILHAKR